MKYWHTVMIPCQVRIKDKEGKVSLIGLGVGDRLNIQSDNLNNQPIQLIDGSTIVEYTNNINIKFEWED